MKLLLLLLLSSLSTLCAYAQHDLYKWHLKGYTGIANYYNPDKKTLDYFKVEDNLWHQLEIGRSIGNTFGLSASASFGKIRGIGPLERSFVTDVRMSSVRLYFYTDNGWLLNQSAFISPFFFGGYGLSTFNQGDKGALGESKYRQVLPFGLGLKFRLTERWQLDLQTEAVYNINPSLNTLTAEQNKYNNGFLHTGLGLAYNFGFKRSSFKPARFYAGFQTPLAPADSIPLTTAANLSTINSRSTPLSSPAPRQISPKLIVIRDTVLVTKANNRQINDTLNRLTVIRQMPDAFYRMDKSRATSRRNLGLQDTVSSTAQEKDLGDKGIAPSEYEPRTNGAISLRQTETARVQEPLRTSVPDYRTAPRSTTRLNAPTSRSYHNNRTPLNPVRQNPLVLIDKDKNELEEANRRNRQLQFSYDSLQTAVSQDKVLPNQPRQQNISYNTLDGKLMRYMQEQAALNESMQQQLTGYENELRRSPQAEVALPTAASSFDTTVFFIKNSYEIPSQDFNNLLACAAWLKANPAQKIQLTGYADKSGKPDYNLVLSRKRVEAVSEFFQLRGIEKERILMQYFGETNSVEPLISLDRKVILNLIE
ncbi:MAG: hypothetical protein AVDCRST_MAG95-2810 [uncultured Adhaeribacter sp.]|uniref:OmpA-like domain-containing protein n=1 Tax=uncultured Adhaeribacter sp. TaxID=448109 RepID=A0A6J4J6F8_9BACT|nr:MAG: hypothetical protein AVDCRST_MAG95-2810 [uncultured Adhaeribacter sp.]